MFTGKCTLWLLTGRQAQAPSFWKQAFVSLHYRRYKESKTSDAGLDTVKLMTADR